MQRRSRFPVRSVSQHFIDRLASRLLVELSVFAIVSSLSLGCANEPGMVSIHLESLAPIAGPNDPICLIVTLKSERKLACIPRRTMAEDMTISVYNSSGNKLPRPHPPAECGMRNLAFFPVLVVAYPFRVMGGLLDVADVGGRFDVIEPGKPATREFKIIKSRERDGRDYMVLLHATEVLSSGYPGLSNWEPGEYRIVVTISYRPNTFFPPPLFWQPYSHTLTSEIKVRVADEGLEPTTQVAQP